MKILNVKRKNAEIFEVEFAHLGRSRRKEFRYVDSPIGTISADDAEFYSFIGKNKEFRLSLFKALKAFVKSEAAERIAA